MLRISGRITRHDLDVVRAPLDRERCVIAIALSEGSTRPGESAGAHEATNIAVRKCLRTSDRGSRATEGSRDATGATHTPMNWIEDLRFANERAICNNRASRPSTLRDVGARNVVCTSDE